MFEVGQRLCELYEDEKQTLTVAIETNGKIWQTFSMLEHWLFANFACNKWRLPTHVDLRWSFFKVGRIVSDEK